MREMGAKELGQAYNQPVQIMVRIKNYSTRPSALPFLIHIPEKPLGQSCGLPTQFTRFIHLQKRYLWNEELGHWENI